LKAKKIKFFGDIEIIIRHVRNKIHYLSSHLKNNQHEVWELIKSFDAFNINHVPSSLNSHVDLFTNAVARHIPSENLLPDTFSMELLYKPSIPNNVTNLRVFFDDKNIISFLYMEDTFERVHYQDYIELNEDVFGSINQSIEKKNKAQ
jgi:hypothetical protein